MCTVPDSAPTSGGILNRLRQRFLKRANLPPPFTTKDFHCHLQVISKGPKTTLFHPSLGKNHRVRFLRTVSNPELTTHLKVPALGGAQVKHPLWQL